jgi:two-component system KDP operon response regulator KdpE
MLPGKVLFIDADRQLRRYVRASLILQGIQPLEAAGFDDGLKAVLAEQPDVIVLDCELEGDVLDQLRRIREWTAAPVILTSRSDSDTMIVAGLDAGAHDYIVKPFRMNVFLARIGVAQRCAREAAGEERARHLICGNLEIDGVAHECRIGNERIELTPREFDLLALLVRHKGKVLTHRFILESVWGKAHTSDVEYVRVFIMQLRAKLERNRPHLFAIRTEIGIGYRLEETGGAPEPA